MIAVDKGSFSAARRRVRGLVAVLYRMAEALVTSQFVARAFKGEKQDKFAIRALQGTAPAEARTHFAVEPDGSFVIDALMIAARK